ncbi:MAG: MscS Mechanosensitive ion channel [Gammaproteobacteria bacterium]|nr:MscS Mechanosensitive ion channel [Gammaproteobacteria bacterium]
MYHHGPRGALTGALLTFFGLCPSSHSSEAPRHSPPAHAPAPAQAPAPTPAGSAPLPPLAPPMTASQVIQVLDQTIDWYRTLGTQQQAANEPSDLLILYDNRQTANKVIALAFEIGRADADMLSKEPTAGQDAGGDAAVSPQALLQLRVKLEAQSRSIQAELDARHRDMATASKKSKIDLQAKINELQGELGLVNTKKSILDTMAGVAAGAGSSSAGALRAQIDAMAVAVPSAGVPAAGAPPAAATAAASVSSPGNASPAQFPLGTATAAPMAGRFGLWDLASNAFRLSEKASIVASIDQRTAALQSTLAQIKGPVVDRIKMLSARGDALAAQADSADSTTLNGVHDQLDALAEQFKQASALLIPLSREGLLLSQYRRNLSNWREAIDSQYRTAMKTLGIRVGLVLIVLALLFGAGELWRRMVLRYIQDSRRRYQLLLLRRIALWALFVVVIGIAFASELGSIATFAGLITAGVAVAMQSVLVSMVGYFFLIGKYGIRVGDRVQIGDVAGEVIDLGLVRMYLMELGAKGAMGPTGRVVAFANSVVFQVSSGLFKQIPGVNFSWREVVLNLPTGADYAAIKERLKAAVTDALKDYRAEILRQTKEIERTTSSSSAGDAQPQVQLHFSPAGVEAHVRYPVHLQHAAEIEERVTQALANAIS